MRLIDDVLKLVHSGWRAFRGEVRAEAYGRLDCRRPRVASWFVRGRHFLCLGCSRRCALYDPAGFQLPLPTVFPPEAESRFTLHPSELVRVKAWLRVKEAAWCLNVSPRQVYKLAAEGVLDRHPESPVRLSAESVRREMERVEE